MYESQISEYKFEIDKLNKELSEVKNKYFLQKKKEHLIKERERMDLNGPPGMNLINLFCYKLCVGACLFCQCCSQWIPVEAQA